MRKIIFFILLFCAHLLFAQSLVEDVRTLRMRYEGATTPQRPFLLLNDPNETKIEISFDQMSHEPQHYAYTIEHLNADQTVDNLAFFEYADGEPHVDINDYELSINTAQLYTHYSFTFPSDALRPTISGNYRLKIFDRANNDEPIAYCYFCVVGKNTKIATKVLSTTDIEYNGRYQQLEIDVLTESKSDEYFIVVEQNGRSDNRVFAPKPTFVGTNQLRFQHQKQLIFEAGNEYQHFDIFSLYIKGVGVRDIKFLDKNAYHAFLEMDRFATPSDAYFFRYDVNGQYVINAERVRDPDWEAEYMWVHFFVPTETPLLQGNVYVGGDLFDNQLNSASRMYYDPSVGGYCLTTLLKQGGYNYQYWYLPKNALRASVLPTAGSFWQTNNEYRIYVFHRPFGSRYDALVGIDVVK